MALNRIRRKPNELNTPLLELWLELRESTQLSGADWGVVFRVAEEDDPGVADEFVEFYGSVCGVG